MGLFSQEVPEIEEHLYFDLVPLKLEVQTGHFLVVTCRFGLIESLTVYGFQTRQDTTALSQLNLLPSQVLSKGKGLTPGATGEVFPYGVL